METALNRNSKGTRWLTLLGVAAVVVAWFLYVGDSAGRPWVLVALAAIIASALFRIPDWKLVPTAERVAWREALIVFVFVSILAFALANFNRPEKWTEPYRMATTLSIPFAWMMYREARGKKKNYWLLFAGMLGVTILWIIAGMLFIW